MSNWSEFLLVYILFSAIIPPCIVYTTYTYAPSDPLGWISKGVFTLISFCCVLVFIPSVIFIYFYHWLYRKRSARKAARQKPPTPSSYEIAVPENSADQPSTHFDCHKFCEIIWYKIHKFCDENGIPSTLRYGVPLWAASYYCILEILDRKGLCEMVRTQFIVTTCECYKIPMFDRDAVKSISLFFDETVSTLTSYIDKNPTSDHDEGAFTGDVPMSLKIALNTMQKSGCEIACDCTLTVDFTILVYSLRDIAMAIAI